MFLFFSFRFSVVSLTTPISPEVLELTALDKLWDVFRPDARLEVSLLLDASIGALSLCWRTDVVEVVVNSLAMIGFVLTTVGCDNIAAVEFGLLFDTKDKLVSFDGCDDKFKVGGLVDGKESGIVVGTIGGGGTSPNAEGG